MLRQLFWCMHGEEGRRRGLLVCGVGVVGGRRRPSAPTSASASEHQWGLVRVVKERACERGKGARVRGEVGEGGSR
eukprot:715909-Rhodomonas_salina.1